MPGFGYFQKNIIKELVTNSSMFIAAVLPTVKTWMQPKCSSMDGWIKKMFYIYIDIYISQDVHNMVQKYPNELSGQPILEKAEKSEIKLPTSAGSSKKQESSRKHLFLLY